MLTMHLSARWKSPLQWLSANRFESSPLGDQPILEVAPQRNRQAPCERHNADAPHPCAYTAKASVKPLTQLTLGLVAQPAPSELHHQTTHAAVADLGDALFGFASPARVGRGGEPETARHLAPVAKAPPTEELLHQHPAAAHPDPAELRKPRHLRFGVGVQGLALLGLKRAHLRLHQR